MTLLKLHNGQLCQMAAQPQTALVDWADYLTGERGTALCIGPSVDLTYVSVDLSGVELICLTFPAFKDGRVFTQARLLRERFGFTRELRALGDVHRDQALFMVRCGFDAFELPASQSLQGFQEALAEFSAFYQHAGDMRTPIWHQRQTPTQENEIQSALKVTA